MKSYERCKPSGIEWIGKIPDHWKVKKLKYLVWTINEKAENDTNFRISLENIESNTGRLIGLENANSFQGELRKFQKGDVLFNKLRPYLAKVYLADNDGVCLGELLILRSKGESLPKFLFYRVLSYGFVKIVDSSTYGSKMPRASWDDFISQLLIPYPQNEEQTAIANYLDRKTGKIDELITKKQKLIDLLNEEKTAIINQAVTKGLNPNAPVKDSGIHWLGEVPAHWEIKKIKYIANLTLGKMLTGEDKGGNFLKPYLRAQNISWFKCDTSDVKEMWFSQSDLIKYRVNLNDLLVSEGGDVGRTCIWMNELDECYIQNSVHKITFKKYFNPKYFLYLFYSFGQKGYFLSIVNQISIGHLTGEKLKEVFTIFPGFDEQTAIVDYLDRKTDQMDDVISKTHHEIELLQEYRTALISEAVTGKIDVRI